jgi:HEAT repeat protein
MKNALGKNFFVIVILAIGYWLNSSIASENAAQAQIEGQGWGKDVYGLQCSIKIEPSEIKVGETFVVDVEIRNVSSNDICFYYQDLYQAEMLLVKNEKGTAVSSSQTREYNFPMPKVFFREIKAGQSFKEQIKGRVALKQIRSSEKQVTTDRPLIIDFFDIAQQIEKIGKFKVCLHIKADEQIVKMGTDFGFSNLWTGEVVSNEIEFNVKQMSRGELDKMISQLRTGNEKQVAEAVEVLKANADKPAVKELMAILASGKGPLRNVSDALVQIKDITILPDLLRMYELSLSNTKNEGSGYQSEILLTINGLDPNQQRLDTLFIKIVKSDNPVAARQYAASYLGMRDNPDAIPALVFAANKGPRNVQLSATEALGWIGSRLNVENKQIIIEPLVAIMRTNSDSDVRQRAVKALGNVGSKLVVPYLIEALKDNNLFVGASAASYLGRYAGPDAIAELEVYFRRAETNGQKSSAADAIKFIGQRASSDQ